MISSRQGDLSGGMKIDDFIHKQNIERYRKLLKIASDQIQRRQIENLLEEELQSFIESKWDSRTLAQPDS